VAFFGNVDVEDEVDAPFGNPRCSRSVVPLPIEIDFFGALLLAVRLQHLPKELEAGQTESPACGLY